MNLRGLKVFAVVGIALFVLLLYGYWFGESGWFAVQSLKAEVAAQEARTGALQENNRALVAEVMALKRGPKAVEARARADLGMVAEGETFYLVVEPSAGAARERAAREGHRLATGETPSRTQGEDRDAP